MTKPDGESAGPMSGCADYFGWEYNGKRKYLKQTYKQLLQYGEDLKNAPLLVVFDRDHFRC